MASTITGVGVTGFDPPTIGRRLADARKARGFTQEEVAERLGCSRPTFIAIEKGTRRPTSVELIALCELYGRHVHEILRTDDHVVDFRTQFRAFALNDPTVELAISSMQRFAENYRRLEDINQAPLQPNYPAEVKLGRHVDVMEQAEDEAIKERRRLGLGDQPIAHLRSLLEVNVGLRIVYEKLPSAMAGMFAYSSEFGAVVAINRLHPHERRRATLAHEYGHLLIDRFKPGIDLVATPARRPANERFAEAFAMAFLMPATSLRARYNDIVNASGDFTVADVCRLAYLYIVSFQAMALRLESLKLIPGGTWDYLNGEGFRVREAMKNLAQPPREGTRDKFPARYVFLAAQAHDREAISEGELAGFLDCDRVTAREIVAKTLAPQGDVDENGDAKNLEITEKSGESLLKRPR